MIITNKPLRYLNIVINVFLLVLSFLFLSECFLTLLYNGDKTDPNFPFLCVVSMLISYLIIFTYYKLYLNKRDGSFVRDLHISKPNNFKFILLSIGLMLINLLLSIGVILLFAPENTSGNQSTQTILNDSGNFSIIVSFLYPVILAPIVEEVMYRGIIGNFFSIFNNANSDKLKCILYVIISSSVFGLMHLQTTGDTYSIFSSFFLPMLSAIIFSLEYLRTKNLTYSIITHSLENLTIILFQTM